MFHFGSQERCCHILFSVYVEEGIVNCGNMGEEFGTDRFVCLGFYNIISQDMDEERRWRIR